MVTTDDDDVAAQLRSPRQPGPLRHRRLARARPPGLQLPHRRRLGGHRPRPGRAPRRDPRRRAPRWPRATTRCSAGVDGVSMPPADGRGRRALVVRLRRCCVDAGVDRDAVHGGAAGAGVRQAVPAGHPPAAVLPRAAATARASCRSCEAISRRTLALPFYARHRAGRPGARRQPGRASSRRRLTISTRAAAVQPPVVVAERTDAWLAAPADRRARTAWLDVPAAPASSTYVVAPRRRPLVMRTGGEARAGRSTGGCVAGDDCDDASRAGRLRRRRLRSTRSPPARRDQRRDVDLAGARVLRRHEPAGADGAAVLGAAGAVTSPGSEGAVHPRARLRHGRRAPASRPPQGDAAATVTSLRGRRRARALVGRAADGTTTRRALDGGRRRRRRSSRPRRRACGWRRGARRRGTWRPWPRARARRGRARVESCVVPPGGAPAVVVASVALAAAAPRPSCRDLVAAGRLRGLPAARPGSAGLARSSWVDDLARRRPKRSRRVDRAPRGSPIPRSASAGSSGRGAIGGDAGRSCARVVLSASVRLTRRRALDLRPPPRRRGVARDLIGCDAARGRRRRAHRRGRGLRAGRAGVAHLTRAAPRATGRCSGPPGHAYVYRSLRHPLVPQPRLRARGHRRRSAGARARARARARGDRGAARTGVRSATGAAARASLCAGPRRRA